jgi:hypothetical protein
MSYQDNVRAAAAALTRGEDANWELARLTFDVCGDAGPGRPSADRVGLRQWSSDVARASGRRFGYDTARYYRDIWIRFGNDDPGRHLPSWSEAYAEIRGGTVADRMASADFSRALEHGTAEIKRNAFLKLSQDPEVVRDSAASSAVFKQITQHNPAAVEEAWQDTETNIRLSTARVNAREELLEPMREARAEAKQVFTPKDTTLEHTNFHYDVQKRVEQWAAELNRITDFLHRTDDVNVITRTSTRRSLDLLIEAATACRDALPSAEVVTAASRPTRRKLA